MWFLIIWLVGGVINYFVVRTYKKYHTGTYTFDDRLMNLFASLFSLIPTLGLSVIYILGLIDDWYQKRKDSSVKW